MKVISLYYFLRNVAELDFGEFGLFEWYHEVEVGKIDAHESCTWCGNDTVEKYFDEEECGRIGPNVFRVVNEIANHGCLGVVGFLFLGAYRAYISDICDVFIVVNGKVGFVNELNGVGAFDTSAHSLGKAAKFVGSRNVLGGFEFGVP
jgi:hypothetical protein